MGFGERKLFKRTVAVMIQILLFIGMLTLAFNIQPVKSSGTIYIRADGSVDPSGAPILRKGDLYTLTSNITSNTDGIVIERDNMTLDGAGCTLKGGGSGDGIHLSGRHNVTIKNTDIKSFDTGILLDNSSNNTVSGNTATNNNVYAGIWLSSSSNNTVSGNDMRNNNKGIWLQSSSGNAIYHNDFINNSQQVSSYGSTNVWDDGYPSGGNFWSDYNGTDDYSGPNQDEIGNDGIGDTSYIIDENNRDRYPLMVPWGTQYPHYNWPMFHRDISHTGYSNSKAPNTNDTIWNYTTGYGGYSSPTVADGQVYIGSGNKVYCLDATTGTLTWNYTTGRDVMSSPAVVDGKVYIGSMDRKVYCLNASTGKHIWNYTTGSGVDSSPAVAENRVYVGSYDGRVYCLDALTGTQIWNYTTGSVVESSPAVADGKVYVGSEDFNVYCLNATSGAHLWNYTTGNGVWSSPAFAYGKVYVGSWDNKIYCLNASSGTQLWNYTTGRDVASSPAVADGKLFVGSWNGKVYCLNASTGAHIWSYKSGAGVYSSPAVADGKVYVASLDGKVYAFGGSHEVAVTDVVPSKTVVNQGYSTSMNVTVENRGDFDETFNVTLYANTTSIATQTVTLTSRNSTTLTFTWNTSGFVKGNYTISAYATPVPSETYTADNNLVDGLIKVTVIGDINGDFKVDIKDLVLVIKYFGSYPSHPTKPWNPNADINSDNKIDIKDLVLVIKHFGEHYP